MSVPKTLVLPAGVTSTVVDTSRGPFAALVASAGGDRHGHVLLVPGWTGSKEDFAALLPLLADAGFDVTAYDQRGQYETPGAPDDDYSLEGFGADALAVASARDAAPSHLLGHSFGGLVAQAAVRVAASAWRSLSLLCTGPAALGDSPGRPLTTMIRALDSLSLAEVHRRRELMAGVERPAEIAAFLERRFCANAPASLRAMTDHLVRAVDGLDAVAASRLRFWVGRGARDDAWPHDVQDAMAARLGVTVQVIDGAAHSPAVENPEALAAAWVPFLLSPRFAG